jgi:hypothetical protein
LRRQPRRESEWIIGAFDLDPALVRKLGGRIDTATFAREKDRASAKVMSLYDA